MVYSDWLTLLSVFSSVDFNVPFLHTPLLMGISLTIPNASLVNY